MVSKCTIYRYVKGCTHKRGKKEARGGKNKVLTKKDLDHLDKVRKRLLKSASNTRRVMYLRGDSQGCRVRWEVLPSGRPRCTHCGREVSASGLPGARFV